MSKLLKPSILRKTIAELNEILAEYSESFIQISKATQKSNNEAI